MNPIAEDMLMHYGMPRRSGRYPWGSGDEPYQRTRDFLGRVEELKKNGWTETAENIKKEFGEHVTLSDYRNEKAWCNYERRLQQVETAKRFRDKECLGPTEIGRRMGLSESTVRSLLNPKSEDRMNKVKETYDFLKEQVDSKKMIDVGAEIEKELGISKERLNLALYGLKGEGYEVYSGGIPQVTNPGQQTNQRVLCVPGTPHKDIYNYDQVKTINEYVSHDGGKTFDKFVYPKSMNSKRLMIRYNEDGGIEKDGIVELRRGVDDLSLGNSRYSQVRILVDGTHYIKGMAVYGDNMPKGIDVIFNTNKSKGTSKMDVLKEIKNDPDNPFGSLIKANGQSYYIDKNGKRQLSLINKRADEGDWTEWKDKLPSQFLGKQSKTLIKKQLGLAKADKVAEFDEIMNLNNPTIKKHYLQKFADECDSAAVHLQAAALPGQKYHVIIPVNSLKDNEVYAPYYENGDKLALIRYPHAGTFEIPILTVNNRHKAAKDLIGNDIIDAIGINKKNADRLSGADFDGDTVMAIPTHDKDGKVKITSTPYLEGLEGFDPKLEYGPTSIKIDKDGKKHYYNGDYEYRKMTRTDTEMGKISNLITDMTLIGAGSEDLTKAVKHSMVVIDAEKHGLDYKRSEIENDIAALKKKYQGGGGASTILSRAKGEVSVDKTQGTPKINIKGKDWYDSSKPEGSLIYRKADDLYFPDRKFNKDTGMYEVRTVDGKKITYNPNNKKDLDLYAPVRKENAKTGEVTFTNKAGDIVYRAGKRSQQSTQMAEADDAYDLVSPNRNPKELLYADYANSMKALANQARKELMSTNKIQYSKSAKETYRKEVDDLDEKIRKATLNAPREREAQRRSNVEVSSKVLDAEQSGNPIKPKDIKKLRQQAITKYRNEVASVSRRDRAIDITDKEWEAIQAGAISEHKLKTILNNTDPDKLRERAMPRSTNTLSNAKINKAKAMSASHYSLEEIARALGVSPSTVSKYLKGVN